MKKGIIRKEQIIQTAERLFYEKGYEETGIQDILDALNLSKGGFYHHFESKMQLLEAIVARQTVESIRCMREAVTAHAGDAAAQLNGILKNSGLWREDGIPYAALLLKTAWIGGSVELRDCVRRSLFTSALPLVNDAIAAGLEQKVFFTRFPETLGELILNLYVNIHDGIAQTIAFSDEGAALGDMLGLLETYRASIETLLNAPFGTVELFDLSELEAVYHALQAQCALWRENAAKDVKPAIAQGDDKQD